jgi:hypothetical protein
MNKLLIIFLALIIVTVGVFIIKSKDIECWKKNRGIEDVRYELNEEGNCIEVSTLPPPNPQTQQSNEFLNCMRACLDDEGYPESWQRPDDGALTSSPVLIQCESQCR